MRTTINVKQIELRQSKAGNDYYNVKTDKGTMSCFDRKNIDKMKVGDVKDVDVVESNGFKNIRNVYENTLSPAEGIIDLRKQDKYEDARKSKDVSMYTSYAKDIFIELIKQERYKEIEMSTIMRDAVELVREAKAEFEDKEIPEEEPTELGER